MFYQITLPQFGLLIREIIGQTGGLLTGMANSDIPWIMRTITR
jgi:hypothetical protein